MATAAKARLALDEDVRRLLARLLQDRGWDAVSILDAGRSGMQDEDQLAWATNESRVLVTHNAADYAALAVEWGRAGRSHAGICIIRQGPIGWLARELLKALALRRRKSDWTDQLVWAGSVPKRR